MIGEILLVSIGLIGLIIATITDLKYREVPDFLNYFLITTGLSFRFVYSILSTDWLYFLYGLIGLGVAFLFGFILYVTKQWGGGDTKLLMSVGVIFATKPFFINGEDSLFLARMFLNIFLAGALYGIGYGVYLAIKNFDNFKKEFKRIMEGEKIRFIKKLSMTIAAIAFILVLMTKDYATKLILLGFVIFLIFYIYLWVFVKSVENACMFQLIPVNKLAEGDWVVDDVIKNKKVIYRKNKLAVDKRDILMFMKEGVKRVKIKGGIPFVPSFLIGTLFTLIWGSLV